MAALLKLRAQDAEDVQVISAVLQDSIVPLLDIAFQAEDKRFVMVAQRLVREANVAKPDRICCAVDIKGVASVETHGIDLKRVDQMLELLAIIQNDDVITLVFAGDGRIRLRLGDWAMHIEDFGEAWPALCNPCHESPLSAS